MQNESKSLTQGLTFEIRWKKIIFSTEISGIKRRQWKSPARNFPTARNLILNLISNESDKSVEIMYIILDLNTFLSGTELGWSSWPITYFKTFETVYVTPIGLWWELELIENACC